jgi:thiol:disulfide interchange protein DsbC
MRLDRNVFTHPAVAFIALALFIAPTWLSAAEQKSEADRVRDNLKLLLPDIEVTSVKPAPVPGLYEVLVETDVVYVTPDGRYLIQGNIIDLETRLNLTASVMAEVKAGALAKVGEENMVIFSAKEPKHTVTVFTDIDCGYCRKLHAQMAEYNEEGINIRYLFYPRAGVGSASYNKAVAVWCADDRLEAMTLSKAGKKVEQKDCENPVSDHYELGRRLGVTGTPALVLDDGEMLPGYIPPDKLANYLKAKKNGEVAR